MALAKRQPQLVNYHLYASLVQQGVQETAECSVRLLIRCRHGASKAVTRT